MRRINSIVWGMALLAVSLVLALNAFELTDIDLFFDGWWTLFIIVPSLIGLFTGHDKTTNIIGLLIGGLLLLACQDIIDFSVIWKLAVPAIIAVIGFKMVFGGFAGNGEFTRKIEDNTNKPKTAFAFFSGQDMNFDNEVFNGAEFTSVFGGVRCDLRNAVFEKDTVINAFCFFGGLDVFLPENVNLKVNSNSIFGGIDAKKHQNSNDNQHTVYLNGTCIFGGVDVK